MLWWKTPDTVPNFNATYTVVFCDFDVLDNFKIYSINNIHLYTLPYREFPPPFLVHIREA